MCGVLRGVFCALGGSRLGWRGHSSLVQLAASSPTPRPLLQQLAQAEDVSPLELRDGAKLALAVAEPALAASLARRALALGGDNVPGADLVVGMVLMEQGMLSKAEESFQRELQRAGISVRDRLETTLNLGRLFVLSHEYMESAGGQCPLQIARTPSALLQEAMVLLDSLQGTEEVQRELNMRAEILACQLSVLVKMEDHQRTLHVLDALDREDPTFEDVWSYRGDCLTSLGRHEEAALAHCRFVSMVEAQKGPMFHDPLWPRHKALALQKAGACFALSHQLEQANMQWDECIQIAQQHPSALSTAEQGTILLQRATATLQLHKEPTQALQWVDRGLELAGPYFFPLLDLRARLLHQMGDHVQAQEAEKASREAQGLED